MKDRGFLSPVATLLTGSGAAFVIGYAAKPIILRLYPVEAFGVYEWIVALVALLLPVASLRFEDAVVLPDDDAEARDVWMLSLTLTVVTVILTAAAVWLLGGLAPEPVQPWLWAAPVLLGILRFSKLAELWLTRRKQFRAISGAAAGQSGLGTGIRVLLGLRAAGPGGLLVGFGAGHLAAGLGMGLAAMRTMREVPGEATEGRAGPESGVRRAAWRYRRFAQFSAPAALVSALSVRLPALLLLGAFGAEVVGWFGQAFAVLFVPLSLAGTAVGQVFFVRAAEARREGRLAQETFQAHHLLAGAAVVPVAGVCAAAPEVFGFLFGPDWATAGQYAVLIAPWIALSAVGSPLTRVFDVTERQRTDLVVNFLMLALVGGALCLGRSQNEPAQAILFLGIAGSAGRVAQIIAALRAAGQDLGAAVLSYARPILEGIALFSVVRIAAEFGSLAATVALGAGLLLWLPFLIRRFRRLQ